MPFNTLSVATAVTPSIIETYVSHYLNKGSLRAKPTAHISYHEGLRLVREFLDYASKHRVEELQAFTAQWVPAPTWVRTKDCEIAPQFILRAANTINKQLGPDGIERVGGKTWWQWRRPESPLRAEWIEMKKDDAERKQKAIKCDRVIMYIHGGAYFFGSVDEHRYQMQRHARKLKARLLAPRYRLAPQFPFPCGLQDCLATYLYLLEHFPPQQIICMGDSAGGGMTLALLVILRDQNLPLPAGAVLLSPWVDLTHSFPSVAGNGEYDYIPPHGFLHRPSLAWPPPPAAATDAKKTATTSEKEFPEFAVELPAEPASEAAQEAAKDNAKEHSNAQDDAGAIPGVGSDNLGIELDGKRVELKDQIQLYAPNQLLSFPLVSPVLQPSLGGLPPMLIQVGGGELLKDEQIYLAHKAAHPTAYPPSDQILDEFDPDRTVLNRYPPTYVQLQVWDDLCHVPHTLSFTSPAKFMYRSVAQFGAWALARSQQKEIDIPNDDAVSISSTDSSTTAGDTADASHDKRVNKTVGRAGDPLPPFKNYMIRQRVDRHGAIFALPSEGDIACLHLDPSSIGRIKPGPVRKWIAAKTAHERKFAKDRVKVDAIRARELKLGYDVIEGEHPPATALVNRRRQGIAPEDKKKSKRSWGLAMWSGWGSKHDEEALREEKRLENAEAEPIPQEGIDEQSVPAEKTSALNVPHGNVRSRRAPSTASRRSRAQSQTSRSTRTRSAVNKIIDEGQAGSYADHLSQFQSGPFARTLSNATSLYDARPVSACTTTTATYADGAAPTTTIIAPDSAPVPGSENTYLGPRSQRPHNGVAAYPFKLQSRFNNASTVTLDSMIPTDGTPGNARTPVESTGYVELPTPADDRAVSLDGLSDAPPVSPIDPAPTSSFQSSAPVFNNRTSVIGRIGADGMPFTTVANRDAQSPGQAAEVELEDTAAENVSLVSDIAPDEVAVTHESRVQASDEAREAGRPPLESFVTAPEPAELVRES